MKGRLLLSVGEAKPQVAEFYGQFRISFGLIYIQIKTRI